MLKLYQEAKAAEQSSDYAKATRSYQSIISLLPEMAEAHANLGNLYYLQAMYGQARQSFLTTIKLKPQLAGPHFFLGVIAFRSRDWQASLRYLREAAELDPSNTLVQLQLGFTYYAIGDYPKAIANLESAVEADKQNDDAWYHLSKLYAQMSRIYFDQLQATAPDSYSTHLARAHFYEGQGSWQEAIAEYEKAQTKKPAVDLTSKLNYLASRAAGKPADWAPISSEADGSTRFLHKPPDSADFLPELGRVRQTLPKTFEKNSSAEQLYEYAENYQLLSYLSAAWLLASSPDSYRAHQLKGQSFEAAGRNEEAVTEYRAALAKKGDLQAVHFAIGNIFWKAGQFDLALPELKAELSVSPNDPQAHYEVADILLSQGELDAATTHYQACLRHAPETVEAHLALERIYTSKGQTQLSLKHLAKAAAVSPSDPTPHYRLWMLYRKLGRKLEAERAQRKFQELKKGDKAAQ